MGFWYFCVVSCNNNAIFLSFYLWSFTTLLYEFSSGTVFNLGKSCWFSAELFTTTGGWHGICIMLCIGWVVSLCLVFSTLGMLVSSSKTLLTSSQFKTLKQLWDTKLFLVTSIAWFVFLLFILIDLWNKRLIVLRIYISVTWIVVFLVNFIKRICILWQTFN